MTEISPQGTVWWCTHCGRIAADKQGRMAALGWTKECTQNAVLVREDSLKTDETGRVIQAEPMEKEERPGSSGLLKEVRLTPAKDRSGSS